MLLGRNLPSAPGVLSLGPAIARGRGCAPWGAVRAPLESPPHGGSGPGPGPGCVGGAEVAGAHRPVSGLGELGRRQAHLSRETARPGVVQMCDWLCWASGLWMYPPLADSKTMAPLGTRIHKTRGEYVCDNGYITWRLLSQ